jgi:hypothetical protein
MGYILTQAVRRTEWNQRRRIVSRLRKPPQALEEFRPGPLFLPRAGKVSFLLDHLNSDPSGPLVITGPTGAGKTMLLKRALCDRPHSVYLSLRATPCSSGEALSQALVTQAGYLMPPNELLSRAIFNREASATTMAIELDKALRVITDVLVAEKKRGWFVKGNFISHRFNNRNKRSQQASFYPSVPNSSTSEILSSLNPANDLPLILPPTIVIDELNAGEISNGLLDDSQFWRLVDWSMHLGDNRLAHVVFSCGLEVADLLDAFPGFRMRRNRVHFDFPRVGTVQDYFLNVVNPFMRDVLGAQNRPATPQTQAQQPASQQEQQQGPTARGMAENDGATAAAPSSGPAAEKALDHRCHHSKEVGQSASEWVKVEQDPNNPWVKVAATPHIQETLEANVAAGGALAAIVSEEEEELLRLQQARKGTSKLVNIKDGTVVEAEVASTTKALTDGAVEGVAKEAKDGQAAVAEGGKAAPSTAGTSATKAATVKAASTEEEEAAADELTSTSSSSPSAPMAALRPPEPATLKSKPASSTGSSSAASAAASVLEVQAAGSKAAASATTPAAAAPEPVASASAQALPTTAGASSASSDTVTTATTSSIPLEDQQLLPPYLPPPVVSEQPAAVAAAEQQPVKGAAQPSTSSQPPPASTPASSGRGTTGNTVNIPSIYDQSNTLWLLQDWEVRRIVDVVGGHLKDIDAIVSAMVRGRHWAAALERLVAGSCDLVERSLDDILTAVVDPGAGPVAGSSPAGVKGATAGTTAAYLGRAGTRGGASVILRSAKEGTGLANKNALTAPPPFDFNVDPSPQRLAVYCRYLRGMALIQECAQRKYTPRRDIINRVFSECPQELEHFMDLGLVMSVNLRGTIKMGGTTHASATLSLNQAGMSVSDTSFGGGRVPPVSDANGAGSSSNPFNPNLILPGTFIAASSPRMRVAFKVLAADPKLQAQTQRIAAVVALQTLKREERLLLNKIMELSNQRKVLFETLSMLVGRETSIRTSIIKDLMSWGSPAVGALLTGKPPMPVQIPVLPVPVVVPMAAQPAAATTTTDEQKKAATNDAATTAAAAAQKKDEDDDDDDAAADKKKKAASAGTSASTSSTQTPPLTPVAPLGSKPAPTTGLGATMSALQPDGYYNKIPTPQQLYDLAVQAAMTGNPAANSASAALSQALHEGMDVGAGQPPSGPLFSQHPFVLPSNLSGFPSGSPSPGSAHATSAAGGGQQQPGGSAAGAVHVPLENYSSVSLLGNPRLSAYLDMSDQALMRCDGQLIALGKKLEQLRYAMMLAQRRCEVPLPETEEWVSLIRSAQISRVVMVGPEPPGSTGSGGTSGSGNGSGQQGPGGGQQQQSGSSKPQQATASSPSPSSSTQPSSQQAQASGSSSEGKASSAGEAATTATAAAVVAPASDQYYYSSTSKNLAGPLDPVQWQSLSASSPYRDSRQQGGDAGGASRSHNHDNRHHLGRSHHHHHPHSRSRSAASGHSRLSGAVSGGAGVVSHHQHDDDHYQDPALFRLQQEHDAVDDAWMRLAQGAGSSIGPSHHISERSLHAQRRENINRKMMMADSSSRGSTSHSSNHYATSRGRGSDHEDDYTPDVDSYYRTTNSSSTARSRSNNNGTRFRHHSHNDDDSSDSSSDDDDEAAMDALSDARDESQYQYHHSTRSSHSSSDSAGISVNAAGDFTIAPSSSPSSSSYSPTPYEAGRIVGRSNNNGSTPQQPAPTTRRSSRVIGRGGAGLPSSSSSSHYYDSRQALNDALAGSSTSTSAYSDQRTANGAVSAARTSAQAAAAGGAARSTGSAQGRGGAPDEHAYVHDKGQNTNKPQHPGNSRPGGYRWWL